MSLRLKFVGPQQDTPESSPVQVTDWKKCVICQGDKKEKLSCPADSKRSDVGAGYISLSKDLAAFDSAGYLPKTLSISRINDGDGIEATLKRHRAKFHKNCQLEYSKPRLKRAAKRENPDSAESSTAFVEKRPCREQVSQNKSRSMSGHLCLFCEKPASPSDPLHEAMTKVIGERVKRCATKLLDQKLLVKVSSGDLVASEARYHSRCLVALYNAADRAKTSEESTASHATKAYYARAFAELIAFIEEILASTDECSPVFKLSDLVQLYRKRLEQLGVSCPCVHSSRLKDRIVASFPELQAFKDGRDILLTSKEDIGTALRQVCEKDVDNDAYILAQAARIIRKEIVDTTIQFDDSFPEKCQVEGLPQSLQTLVAMLCDGPSIKDQSLGTQNQAQLSICQLIVFNSLVHRKKQTQVPRHSKSREPPLPVYLGVLLHNKTRKRNLVDTLHELGLSVSYDRVLEISTDLGSKICKYYNRLDTVCPPQLKKGVFTSSAVDNINHQTSSTTAKSSFNGTGISVFQHYSNSAQNTESEHIVQLQESSSDYQVVVNNFARKSLPKLPMSYTQVPPVTQGKLSCAVPSLETPVKTECPLMAHSITSEYSWLQHVFVASTTGAGTSNVSWSAFHASQEDLPSSDLPTTTSCLLPLFQEDAATVAMVKHSLDVIKKLTGITNPGQTPVVAMDQPLFAIAKNVQWKWPLVYGETKIVIMFGGLHIELAALKTLGDFLRSSGWTSALVQAGVATVGSADSFLKAAHITRTRRAHQITACVLYQALKEAHNEYVISLESDTEALSLEDWCDQQCSLPMFKFWFTVLQLELTILVFVRSIRIGNFQLYVQSLTKLVPWFFSLDRFNYSRWISVHLRDMVALPHLNPHIYQEFMKGHFTVLKTKHAFSRIAIDQAHEQNNAVVKDDGGAIGLTESPSALQRWMVSGPEMARLVNEFEASINYSQTPVDTRHHEERPGVQKAFLRDVRTLKASFDEYGNPFSESSNDLLVLDTRDVADKEVVDTLYRIEELGVQQYNTFVRERLVDRVKPLDDTISKNMLRLFSTSKKRQKTKAKEHLAEVKSDRNLFSRLYVACQVRDGNLEEFFCHENQPCPPSLSDRGRLRLGKKSDIVTCLEDEVSTEYTNPSCDVVVLDGAAIVNLLKPRYAKTFYDYASDVFLPYVKSQVDKVQRVDVVWDEYRVGTLKQQTREKRGKGFRRRVAPQNAVPKNWEEFLRHSDNKKELFSFLGREVITIQTEKQVISTLEEGVICRHERCTEGLAPCSHEEADTRIMLHVADAAKEYKSVTIRTVDSDVVVLAAYAFAQLRPLLNELWVAFGTGKHYRLISAHGIYAAIGVDKCLALPMFHAFTGCDTVSSFSGRGKKTAWEIWRVLPEVTAAFHLLMKQPKQSDVEYAMRTLERFVVLLYDKTSCRSHVNEVRLDLFTQKGREVLHIPPTVGALIEHVRRAAYQAGYCWSQSLQPMANLPQPEGWGWTRNNGEAWEVLWSKLPEASKVCRELLSCGCTKGCRTNCKCRKAALPCTALCKCAGSC